MSGDVFLQRDVSKPEALSFLACKAIGGHLHSGDGAHSCRDMHGCHNFPEAEGFGSENVLAFAYCI